MYPEIRQKIEQALNTIIGEVGLDLIEFNIEQRSRTVAVVIFADRPSGGITIDECANINKRLSDFIDKNKLIDGDYVVEVSSPGLDRPIKTKADFERSLNKRVDCYLNDKVEGKVQYTGEIFSVSDEIVTLETKFGMMNIPIEKIRKAVQIIE